MDLDALNDRLDDLRALRSDLESLQERADELDVELDADAFTMRIYTGERMAALLREADMEDLKRMYEMMAR